MAIYHLAAKVISRGQGHSAVAAAAYRAAQELTLEREGSTWDYSKKLGVEHTEIMLPQGAPDWMADRERLWNAVENGEKRKDAQLAREVLLALLRELSDDQQVALVQRYVQKQFVARGMVADVAIHRTQGETPHAHDEIGINRENPHAHILLTMRRIEGDGFGNKAREWNGKELLIGWREQWAVEANHELELAGRDIRIDHRSYEAQGIELEPGIHHGTTAGRAKGRDEYSRAQARVRRLEEIQRRNADAIVDDPAIALRALTHQQELQKQRGHGNGHSL